MTAQRRPLIATLLGTAVIAALLAVAPVTSSVAAPIDTDCGTASPSAPSGKFTTSICWIDFAGFDSTEARSVAGQAATVEMGDYTATFTIHQSDVSGWNTRSVSAVPATLVLGSGYYAGIPGSPLLYANTGAAFGGTTIEIRDVEVTLGGTPVTGYSLVSASAETPDAFIGSAGERIIWNSDQPLSMIDSAYMGVGTGGCVVPLSGIGTPNVICNPSSTPGGGTYGAILAAGSASRISATMTLNQGGEREAIALGIMTSRLTLEKTVDGRVDTTDSFDLAITSPEGPTLATGTTGSATTASTGSTVVIPTGSFTLAEAASTGAASPLSYYDTDWSCTNATVGSTTVLPTGSTSSTTITPAIGDDITCEITNTALEPELTLVKSASATSATVGNTLTYSFAVTNSGELPVSSLAIDEDSFSGSGALSAVSCLATTLAVGASTSCSATYAVTAADVATGTLSNTASARGLVSGTTAVAASALSSADVTMTAAPAAVLPAAPTGALAASGPEGIFPLLAGALALLVLGAGTLVVTRRRRRA